MAQTGFSPNPMKLPPFFEEDRLAVDAQLDRQASQWTLVKGQAAESAPLRAADQSTCLAVAELQHDIGGELIGRVFRSPENRDIVYVEHCVPNLVGSNI